MQIVIDINASLPLFAQLVEQIKSAVLEGKIKPGDALPSIRQLANDLEINSKTVAKSYRLLERDSVIQTRGYRGTIIHPNANENCTVDLNQWLENELVGSIASYRESGLTDSEIRIAFADVMNRRKS